LRTEGGWAKEIRWWGVSGAVVKIVMFCKRQGIEWLAEQLLASWEGLFTVTLVVIHSNDLTVIVLNMYKAAAVSSALKKVYIIPHHDRGHINVMLV